ncbi:ABC transporter substrate-binding protein [Flavisolibacter sp. BT320]|nr:ABC transporter substrate-binding protein [Flavisolibacter longurius]
MAVFTDQMQRRVSISSPPKRIVSLVPSQTELLAALGLEEQVVGITKFCIHPNDWFRNKARIGGTKNVNLEKVAALAPDLIIANKEENLQEQVEALAEQFPVYVSDVNNLDDALQMIAGIGRITGKEEESNAIASAIQQEFSQLKISSSPIRAAYLIWKDPYMTVGGDTFIHDMLEKAGFQNCFADRNRYPAVTIEELQQSGCEVVLLSSEPYPFREKQVAELEAQLPGTKVLLVDGELFSWYGSRLLKSPAYFRSLQTILMA